MTGLNTAVTGQKRFVAPRVIGRVRSRRLSDLCQIPEGASVSQGRCRSIIANVHTTIAKNAYQMTKTVLPSIRMYNGANATRGQKRSRSIFVKFTPVGGPGVTVTMCIRGNNFNTICKMPVKTLVVRRCLGKGLSPRGRVHTRRCDGEIVVCKGRRHWFVRGVKLNGSHRLPTPCGQ